MNAVRLCLVAPMLMTSAAAANDGLPANAVVSLLHDGDRLWIGTIEGLASFDGEEVTRYAPESGEFGAHIISLHAGRDGVLWIGTNGSGIFQLQNGVISRPEFHQRLQGSMVLDFHERPDGVLWIATSRGLMRRGGDRVDMLDSRSGLPDSFILSLLDDGKGTGLGLAVTHGIVDGAGGWIDIESGRGAGTVFHVILPVRRH